MHKNKKILRGRLVHYDERPGERARLGGLTPSLADGEFGDAFVVVAAVREHPTIGRENFAASLCPLAVIGGMAGNPTLQVVAMVGGENFASSEIVCEMSHGGYLSFLITPILYHKMVGLSILNV